jgi:hypothetical protein
VYSPHGTPAAVRIAETEAAVEPFPFVPPMRIEEYEEWGFPREARRASVRLRPGLIFCGPSASSHASPEDATTALKPLAPSTF